METKKFESYLNDLLNITQIQKDFTTNGLQIEGKEEIKKIALSVDASQYTIEKAIEKNADALIVHHGLFWPSIDKITGQIKKKIKTILDKELNLFVYHLPLDLHMEFGHNKGILDFLNADFIEVKNYSFVGELAMYKNIDEIVLILKEKLNTTNIKIFDFKKEIKKIAVCSGAGANEIYNFKENEIDLFITGELKHSIYQYALDNHISLIGAGHYATERVGILKLQEHLSELVETIYIEDWIDL